MNCERTSYCLTSFRLSFFLAETEKVVTSDFTEKILATRIVKTLTAETETGLNFITHVMALSTKLLGGGGGAKIWIPPPGSITNSYSYLNFKENMSGFLLQEN